MLAVLALLVALVIASAARVALVREYDVVLVSMKLLKEKAVWAV
ncbi:hypothetical protein KSZ_56230 [Dictyobacter formicarum]|uniref:Uncharacterized protein n=1 Tax=Dictyobacter formicarum TaxID=2778368 RepID=A0ABQ3VN09_9CHLR|nr:hypothetical protein KSZ_56230 [Dictyobacter formicarum]